MLERLRPKLAPLVGVRLEGRSGSAQPLELGPQLIDHQAAISRAASSA
jgi:hypothetical protein